ncbi:MAG: histidinol-phosphate transaminase [Clostridiales bacterium]|nr:histidinol-phosphate transaminase [Clostridiales bacterium]
MSRFWNEKTRNIEPYVAGEQPKPGQKIIKLNTNENPYPASPKVREVLDTVDIPKLARYPETSSLIVREELAKVLGVTPEQVFCGNGSDEVLAFSFQAFFESGEGAAPLLVPDISYSFYPVYADLYSIPIRKIPLKDDFSIDVSAFCEGNGGGVAFANPNAPTSLLLELSDVEKILQANPDHVVLVDEAYAAFSGVTARSLLPKYKNLLVTGTLSKSHSLAGLRLGFAVGDPELIEGLTRIRDSFNSYPVDCIAQKVAAVAVSEDAWVMENVRKICATRDRIADELRSRGWDVLPSKTNFLFASPKAMTAEAIYTNLRGKGILVRYFNKPRISEYLRITVGTDEEMDELVKAIDQITGGMDA